MSNTTDHKETAFEEHVRWTGNELQQRGQVSRDDFAQRFQAETSSVDVAWFHVRHAVFTVLQTTGTPVQWDAGKKMLSIRGMENLHKKDRIGNLVAQRVYELSDGKGQPSLYLGNGSVVGRVGKALADIAGQKKLQLQQTVLTTNMDVVRHWNAAEVPPSASLSVPGGIIDVRRNEIQGLQELPWQSTVSVVQADGYTIQNYRTILLSQSPDATQNTRLAAANTSDTLICCMTSKDAEEAGRGGGFFLFSDPVLRARMRGVYKYLVTDAAPTEEARKGLKFDDWTLVTKDEDWDATEKR